MENFMREMKLRLVALICTTSREFIAKKNKREEKKGKVPQTSQNAEEVK